MTVNGILVALFLSLDNEKQVDLGVLVLCSMISVVGSVCVVPSGNVKHPNVFLEDERYNQKIHDKNLSLKYTESFSGTDYNNERNKETSGGCIQRFIFVTMVINNPFCVNPMLITG